MPLPGHKGWQPRKPYTPPPHYNMEVSLLRGTDDEGRFFFFDPRAVNVLKWSEGELLYFMEGGEVYRGTRSLNQMMDVMGPGFVRLNRQYAVQARAIRTVHRREVTLWNGEKLPISRRQFAALYERSVAINQNASGASVQFSSAWWWDRS